jgi:FKBP-type peptidyl-prolyl cis-trans isomerase FkpA
MTRRFAALVPALFVIAAACAKEEALPGDITRATFAPALDIDLERMTRTPRGLYYRDLAAGDGAAVSEGQRVSLYYTGNLANGVRFDSNVGGAPFSFQVGAGEVIAGFDEGVTGMRVGGRRRIIIPPELGYGEGGTGPIPPNAILVFTIEVAAVQ